MPKTKRYERSVPTRAKNQRATHGQPEQRPDDEHREADGDPQELHGRAMPLGLTVPETTDSTSSAEVSVTAVAPTTVATARLRASPICRSSG